MDAVMKYLILAFFTGAVQCQIVEFVASSDFWSQPYSPGANVTLRCNATEYAVGTSSLQHMQIVKTIQPTDGRTALEVDIATNVEIGKEYKDLVDSNGQRRYSVHFEIIQADKIGQLTLTITSITGADTGNYTCKAAYNQTTTRSSVARYLHVQGDVSTVKWYKRDSAGNKTDVTGTVVTMSPGWDQDLVCEATAQGALIQPTFHIYHQDNNGNNTNLTSLFTSDAPEDQVTQVVGKAYTFAYTTIRSYSYGVAVPDRKLNGQMLRCNVTAPGYNIVHNALVTVQVLYTPSLTCETMTYYAKVDEESTITCTGHGNPKPVVVLVATDGVVLMSNMTDVHAYEIAIKSEDDYTLTVAVTTMKVKKEDFGKLEVYAFNEVGNSPVVSLELKEGADPVSEASSHHVSLLLSLIVLLWKFIVF